jgi:iron complex outermembrane receptor protein
MKNSLKIICLAMALAFCASSGAAQPEPRQKVAFNIAAQPIGDALNALAAQSGLQVVLYSDQLGGLRSPALVGNYTARQALDLILANTALTAQFIDANTVAIRSAKGTGKGAAATDPADQMRLAAEEQTRRAQGQAATEKDAAQVVVEGTRDPAVPYSDGNIDLPRTMDDVQPYYIFDDTAIERSGATNIEDFLRTRLTMNASVGVSTQHLDGGEPQRHQPARPGRR